MVEKRADAEDDGREAGLVRSRDGLPLYRQILEELRRRIRLGIYAPGTRIPSEYELCDEFSVSRISVRQALAELAHGGWVERRRGSGTYVSPGPEAGIRVLRAVVTEDQWTPPLTDAVAAYNADHPMSHAAVSIQVVGRPLLRSTILAAVGQGEAPDIGLLDWPWVAEFAHLRFLSPLDELAPEWVNEFRLDSCAALAAQQLAPLYGVQPEANVSLIWYRRDWLEEAEIDPPGSWAGWVDAAKALRGKCRQPIVFAGGTLAGETTTYQLLPFLWSAGDAFLAGHEAALTDGAVRAMQFLSDLIHVHHVAPAEVAFYAWDQPATVFGRGRAAFAVGGSYEKARIQEVSGWDEREFISRVGCMPIPAAPGGGSIPLVGGMAYVVFRQSRHANLACEVIQRVLSPPIMREFCRRSGRCPTRVSVVRTLDPSADWFPVRTAELLKTARPRFCLPGYFGVSEQFQQMVENVVTRQLSPDEAVRRAKEITGILLSGQA